MSPEPEDIELRDRVAKLEAVLMAITSKRSPSQTPPSGVGAALGGGSEAATNAFNAVYSPIGDSLYSVLVLSLDPCSLLQNPSSVVSPSTGPNVSPYPSLLEPPFTRDGQKTTANAQSPCRWLEENVPVIAQVARQQLSSSHSTTPNSTPSACTSCTYTNIDMEPCPQPDNKRTPYETELLSHLPKKEVVDELVEIYFTHTDACHASFSPVFYQSYKKFWETPSYQSVDVSFLGLLFIVMANAVHVRPDSDGANAEQVRSTIHLYNRLSNQITDDPNYNLHIDTVEAILLQSMFLLNEVSTPPLTRMF